MASFSWIANGLRRRDAAPLGDNGRDADWCRTGLADRGDGARMPSRANRNAPIPHDTVLCRRRLKIENMFGGLTDWRRIHARRDRRADTFTSAISFAAA